MARPYDLASLSDVKAWLDVSGADDDALLSRLVSQISRAILAHLDRPAILPATYAETLDGGGQRSLALTNWPVNAILSVSIDGEPLRPSDYDLEAAEAAPPGGRQSLSLRGRRFPCGARNVEVAYSAGYQVSGETAPVPLLAPFVVAAAAPYGDWASDVGVVAGGTPLAAVSGAPGPGQYSVAGGVYAFSSAQAGAAATLTYGYVPADLGLACMDWVAERYAYRGRIGQSSKSLGGQETMAFIVRDMPEFVAAALRPYRRVCP